MEGQITIDLNWRVVPRAWLLPDLSESAWNRLGSLSVGGVGLAWLAPEDLLFLLCLHGCKHKWERLKWIFDVAELVRVYGSLNWHELMDYARRTGSERMVGVSLFLASDLLGASLPTALLDLLRADSVVVRTSNMLRTELLASSRTSVDAVNALPFLSRLAERYQTKLACWSLVPIYFARLRLKVRRRA
jgi:hypothetical protein